MPQASRRGRRTEFRPQPGRVYRTADLGAYSKNPTRLAKRLVAKGDLVPMAGGLYGAPEPSSFGPLKPSAEAALEAFLKGTPYLRTGPEFWNALGLGSTALFPVELVYNTKRTGDFEIGGRRYRFLRKAFPTTPTAEWYAVDLLEHHRMAGVGMPTLIRGLAAALRAKRLDATSLRATVARWGTSSSRRAVAVALNAAATPDGTLADRRGKST